MSVTLNKTRPGIALHMGALLRDALAFQGITVRVDKPWRSLPSEYLVAEREGYTRVWIHAASCNGTSHYDISRAELMAVAAVITDDVSTRFVYDGFSDESARPVAQADAMAAAVARHFGMPVREAHDPFADVAPACDTIGCKAAATHLLSYPDRDSGEVYSDKVCEPCGESFTRRPALRATLAPLGSE